MFAAAGSFIVVVLTHSIANSLCVLWNHIFYICSICPEMRNTYYSLKCMHIKLLGNRSPQILDTIGVLQEKVTYMWRRK